MADLCIFGPKNPHFLLIAPKLHQSRNSKIEDDSYLPNLVEKLYSKFKAEILKNVGCETLFDKSC